MGVPKNFHQKVNLPKIAEALSELNFYEFDYTVVLTEGYNKKLRESEILGYIIETDLDVISRKSELELLCKKNFSALDDESANNKIKEWLENKIDKKEITSYQIENFKSNTFYEELEERNLSNLFVNEKRD